MYSNPYASSLETRILAATPLELVRFLYEGALEAVQSARAHLAQGRIPERGQAVTKAVAILTELSLSLDVKLGGELATRLAGLYDYMQRILLDANFHQADGGLRETESLLQTLLEAWQQTSVPAQAADAPAWLPAASDASGHSRSWSA
jgi:flagellar protein FliS